MRRCSKDRRAETSRIERHHQRFETRSARKSPPGNFRGTRTRRRSHEHRGRVDYGVFPPVRNSTPPARATTRSRSTCGSGCATRITFLLGEIAGLQRALVSLGEKNADVIIPGYTHLQRAQPVYLAHHLLAYVEMLERDCERLWDCHSPRERLPARPAARSPVPRCRSTACSSQTARLRECQRRSPAHTKIPWTP